MRPRAYMKTRQWSRTAIDVTPTGTLSAHHPHCSITPDAGSLVRFSAFGWRTTFSEKPHITCQPIHFQLLWAHQGC